MHAPWDFVLVAAAASLATVVLVLRLRLRRGRVLVLGLLAIALVPGWFYVDAAGRQAASDLELLVTALAPTYARELELMGHERIGLGTKAADPLYLAMIEAEKRWLANNPNVSDIYTFRRLADGGTVLIVDSETDYDRNGAYSGERERRTAIGEPYPVAIPALDLAFAGRAAFEKNPQTDRWGTWTSSFTPMHDSAGKVEAVLGVDYDAFLWVAAIARSRAGALSIVGAVWAVLLIVPVAVSRLRHAAAEAGLRNSELAAARDAALAASRTKSQFMASVSHELRTPLHVFLGMNELLLTSSLDDKQRRLAETARRSAEGLLGMVDDLLDFAQLEAGKAQLEDAIFSPAEMLAGVAEGFRVAAEQKRLVFVVEDGIDAGLRVIGDGRRLRQILRHLLSNAVKFTDSGEIRVCPSVAGREAGVVELVVEVRDTGNGIAPEQRAAVFERFSQIDPSSTRRYGGTGIGLALSKRLAEQMGGAIDFNSEPRCGTVFKLRLPLRLAPPAEPDGTAGPPFREA